MKKIFLISILFFTLYNTSNATLTTPGIVSPFNGATNQNPNVQIDWSSVTGATNYEFKLGTNPTLSGVPDNLLVAIVIITHLNYSLELLITGR